MFAYAVRRILQFIPTILAVIFIIFLLLNVLPGNAALMAAGEQDHNIDLHYIEQMKKDWGLDKPVWLRIEDDQFSLEDAASLWGIGIFETEEKLEETIGIGMKCLSIGPAGEHLVPFACVGSESYRQMGRGGVGTLFGSKNLKAIAVRGTGGVQVAEIGEFWGAVSEHLDSNLMTIDNQWAKDQGTPMLVDVTNEMGIHPTRNFTKGVNPNRRKLDSDAVTDIKIGDRACATCPLGCGNFTSVNGVQVEGPEYETLCLGGSNCEVNDMEQVMRFNRKCDDLGLDTMSTGNVIGLEFEGDFAGANFNVIELFNTAPPGGPINMVSQILNCGNADCTAAAIAASGTNTLATAVDVVVTGVIIGGGSRDIAYTVTLFDPSSVPACN